ncbi:hypothetical protein ROZALSC1DRAFT_26171, partial [Rozella allomycis CSF55]
IGASKENFFPWWDAVFNKAAKNLENGNDGGASKSVILHSELSETHLTKMTDEQIFEFCGKRRARKGARPITETSGKLKRLEELYDNDKNISDKRDSKESKKEKRKKRDSPKDKKTKLGKKKKEKRDKTKKKDKS